MSNSLSLSWSEVRFGGLKEVCEVIEAALMEVGIDFYFLIGAQARDLWYAKEGAASRVTRDIDFAIMVSDTAQYESLKKILNTNHGFEEQTGNAFSMRAPNGTKVDILPFGGIEEEDRVIADGHGLTSIHVAGFMEIATAGLSDVVFEEEGSHFRLATLPAIVLLKLIAYDDRPEKRSKDAEDISHILSNYFNLQADVFYDVHYDVLEGIDDGTERMAARVIGRQIAEIVRQSPPLESRLKAILNGHRKEYTDSRFMAIMAAELQLPLDEIDTIMQALQNGLDETAP